MFTGCIEATGRLGSRKIGDEGGRLAIVTDLASGVGMGDSIAVNGACLTVENIDCKNNMLIFYTLAETLARTNLGTIDLDSPVNLERACKIGDRLDGHLLTGHIDCTTVVLGTTKSGEDTILKIQLPESGRRLIINKGSVAIDGISLTVASLGESSFDVHIIPYTLGHTNLGTVDIGTTINLEFDLIGKYVERLYKSSHQV